MAYVIASFAAGFAEIVAQFAPLQIQQARQRLDQHGFPAPFGPTIARCSSAFSVKSTGSRKRRLLVPDHASPQGDHGVSSIIFHIGSRSGQDSPYPCAKIAIAEQNTGFAGAHSNIIVYGFPSDPIRPYPRRIETAVLSSDSEPSAKIRNPNRPKAAPAGMPKQTMHRDSRSPPNRAPAQSDPSASRRAETIVPAAGFRTFPQRPQTDARTAPSAYRDKTIHVNPRHPLHRAHRTAPCRAEDSAKADSARPGDQCDGRFP